MINYSNALAWYNKGFDLYSLGKYEQAIKCYDEAIKINPGYAKAKTGFHSNKKG